MSTKELKSLFGYVRAILLLLLGHFEERFAFLPLIARRNSTLVAPVAAVLVVWHRHFHCRSDQVNYPSKNQDKALSRNIGTMPYICSGLFLTCAIRCDQSWHYRSRSMCHIVWHRTLIRHLGCHLCAALPRLPQRRRMTLQTYRGDWGHRNGGNSSGTPQWPRYQNRKLNKQPRHCTYVPLVANVLNYKLSCTKMVFVSTDWECELAVICSVHEFVSGVGGSSFFSSSLIKEGIFVVISQLLFGSDIIAVKRKISLDIRRTALHVYDKVQNLSSRLSPTRPF